MEKRAEGTEHPVEEYEETRLWGLTAIGTFFHWIEELTNTIAGPFLQFGLGIALMDLLTDGALTTNVPGMLWTWAASQVVGIDVQITGTFARIRRAWHQRRVWTVLGLTLLGLALCFVGYIAALTFSMEKALNVTTTTALARIGFPQITWLQIRAGLSVSLVALSALTRYRAQRRGQRLVNRAAEDEKAKLRRELELEPLRQQLRAQKAVGAAKLGRAFAGNLFSKEAASVADTRALHEIKGAHDGWDGEDGYTDDSDPQMRAVVNGANGNGHRGGRGMPASRTGTMHALTGPSLEPASPSRRLPRNQQGEQLRVPSASSAATAAADWDVLPGTDDEHADESADDSVYTRPQVDLYVPLSQPLPLETKRAASKRAKAADYTRATKREDKKAHGRQRREWQAGAAAKADPTTSGAFERPTRSDKGLDTDAKKARKRARWVATLQLLAEMSEQMGSPAQWSDLGPRRLSQELAKRLGERVSTDQSSDILAMLQKKQMGLDVDEWARDEDPSDGSDEPNPTEFGDAFERMGYGIDDEVPLEDIEELNQGKGTWAIPSIQVAEALRHGDEDDTNA